MIYKLVTGFMHFWYKFWFGAKISGTENMPKEGKVVVCVNHISNHDAVLAASFLPRRLKFVAKKELFVPIVGPILKSLGAIPVNRGKNDLGAVKASLRALKEEQPLLICPQGTRCKELKREDFKPGAVFLAVKSGAPVLPMGISGKYKFRGGLKFTVGKPIDFSGYDLADDSAENLLYKTIEDLVNNG